MIRDLVESAIDMVRTERETEVEDLANEKTDERLLDLLLPKPAEAKGAPAPATAGIAADRAAANSVFVVSASGGVTSAASGVTGGLFEHRRVDRHPDDAAIGPALVQQRARRVLRSGFAVPGRCGVME